MCDAHTGILLLFVSQELERQAAEAAAQAEKAAGEADGQALQSIKAVALFNHRSLKVCFRFRIFTEKPICAVPLYTSCAVDKLPR